MNIKPHILNILATTALSVTTVASASADDFESLYDRPGVTVVRLYPPMLNELKVDRYVSGQNDFVLQRLDDMMVFSAEKCNVNDVDFDKINDDIQQIIDRVRPEPQIMMQSIGDGERTTIYGQAASGDTSGRKFSRIIIFTNDGYEINLINIGGSITVSPE